MPSSWVYRACSPANKQDLICIEGPRLGQEWVWRGQEMNQATGGFWIEEPDVYLQCIDEGCKDERIQHPIILREDQWFYTTKSDDGFNIRFVMHLCGTVWSWIPTQLDLWREVHGKPEETVCECCQARIPKTFVHFVLLNEMRS